MTAVFVCHGSPTECPNCGGWNGRLPIIDGAAMAPEQFCSGGCAEEAARFRDRARREAASNWCPACGYDNHEHADGCSRGVVAATPRGR